MRRGGEMIDLPSLPEHLPRNWVEQSKCAKQGKPTSFFYPPGKFGKMFDKFMAEIREYCESCPVKKECLDFAMASKREQGVWGGFSESERRAMLNKKRVV